MPPKHTQAANETPLEEGSTSTSPKDQVTLNNVLQILRLQNDKMHDLIQTLHE